MTSGIVKTRKEIETIVDGFGYILLDKYTKHSKQRVIIQDSVGYKYDSLLGNIYRNKPHFVSSFNPFSLENIYLWLKLNKKIFSITKENCYIDASSSNLIFLCFVCKEKFFSSWNTIRSNYNCGVCSGKQVANTTSLSFLRPELVKEWSNKNIVNPETVSLHSGKHVLWTCKKCGFEWKACISDRSAGSGCPACSGNIVTDKNRLSLLFPNISKEWNFTKNKTLIPENISFGSNKRVWWKCLTCGYEWMTSPLHRSWGTNCPNCKESRGEKRISNFLNKNSIFFIPEYGFDNCKNIYKLPFDFYLPEYNILIEYDGILHYKDTFNNPTNFEKIKTRDAIKTKYCVDNNILLIRIPYWEFNNIEDILNDCLKKQRGRR